MSTTEFIIVAIAVILGAIVKSVTGMGLPLVALPIISLFVGAETGIAVLAIPAITQNAGIVASNWHARRDARGLATFCGAGAIGVVLGTLSLGFVPEQVTVIALVISICMWLYQQIRHPEHRVEPEREGLLSPVIGFVAGIFQGGSGVSGPIVAAWHHSLRLTRDAFVFSIAIAFGLIGIAQTATLGLRGHLQGRLLASFAISAIVLASVPLGPPLRRRLSSRGFERAVLGLVAASCVSLSIDIVVGLIR